MLPVTAFFAGLLGFLYLWLTILVIRRRISLRLALGDGGDTNIMRRIRAHANFAEYVPFALILMGIGELNGQHKWVLATLGTFLVLARLSHAYSLIVVEARKQTDIKFRSIGMVLTLMVIGILSILVLVGR